MKKFVVLCCLLSGINFAFAENSGASHSYKLIEKRFTIDRDLTYTLDVKKVIRVNDASSIKYAFQDTMQFSPQAESVLLSSAFVTHEDKSREYVNKKLIHTRNLFSAQSGPGYNSQLEQIVIFPKIKTGDLLQANWHVRSASRSMLGLNIMSDIDTAEQIDEEVIYLNMPKNLTLHWQKRGDVTFKESINHNRRLVEVHIKHIPGLNKDDPLATSKQDRTPLFMASTLPGWDAIGKLYHKTAKDKAKVTPKVRRLATKIVGNKTGKDAAKAIYDWVAQNIKYVYLPLNVQSGFVPHYADEILDNGFGDCKDHVTLMQALLAARGIKSEPVLIGWNNSFHKFPLSNPNQFNHVIIYLPEFNIYSNPTSDSSPFESMDIFLSGKFVVHAGEKPRTAITPAHKVTDNNYVIDTHVKLENNGSLAANGNIKITGFADGMVRKLVSGSQDDLDKFIKQMLADGYEGGAGKINPRKSVIDNKISVDFNWQSPEAVEMSDTIYFTIPRGIDFSAIKFINRLLQNDNHLERVLVASKFTWYYHIKVPQNYHLMSLPKDRKVQNKYGSYTVNYSEGDKEIIVKRHLVINKDLFTDKEYNELKQVLLAVKYDSASTIVLKS